MKFSFGVFLVLLNIAFFGYFSSRKNWQDFIEFRDSQGTSKASFESNSRTCRYLNHLSQEFQWKERLQNTEVKNHKFLIENQEAGPSNYWRSTFDSLEKVDPIFFPSSTNASYIPSGYNIPINENNPNQYFWWVFPEQIKLAWTERDAEMRVTWVTFLNYEQKLAYRPVLCPSADSNWTFIDAEVSIFDAGESIVRLERINTAVIDKLKPECTYEYLVGNTCFWSNVYTFKGRTPYYKTTPNSDPASFIVIGDWGTGRLGYYTKYLLEEDINLRTVNGILYLGDMAYELYELEGRRGDDFFNMIQNVVARNPFMTVPGNHEGHNNFSHYLGRMRLPENEDNNGTGLFYSFNFGPAHFIMFNTEQYYADPMMVAKETHFNWLVSDLEYANSQRDVVPWIFFFTHHAFYCSSDLEECKTVPIPIREALEDLLVKFKVDIVFQAHIHAYERDKAMYKGKDFGKMDSSMHVYENPDVPVYVVNGHAGNFIAHNAPFIEQKPEYFIFGCQDYGYGRLRVLNRTHVHYEEFSSERLREVDYFWLVKDR